MAADACWLLKKDATVVAVADAISDSNNRRLQELLLASIYSRRGASPPTSKQANKQAERKLAMAMPS